MFKGETMLSHLQYFVQDHIVAVSFLGYMLLALAAMSFVAGGTRKPTPRPDISRDPFRKS
jgi:hypothetical protein